VSGSPWITTFSSYYTKTRENRLLAGPVPVEGAYVLGALSGYGLMASNGAAELLADYIAGRPLPRYARRSASTATTILGTARCSRGGATPASSDLPRPQTSRSRSRELIASTTITIATVTRRTVEAAG